MAIGSTRSMPPSALLIPSDDGEGVAATASAGGNPVIFHCGNPSG